MEDHMKEQPYREVLIIRIIGQKFCGIVYQLSREEHLTDSSFFRGGYSCITNISQSITTIIDTEGRTVSEIRDVSIAYPVTDDARIITVDDKGQYGLRSINNEVIIEQKYLYIIDFSEGKAMMKDESGLWGVVASDGTVLLPCCLDLLSETGAVFNNGYVMTKLTDGEWIILNDVGEIVHKTR